MRYLQSRKCCVVDSEDGVVDFGCNSLLIYGGCAFLLIDLIQSVNKTIDLFIKGAGWIVFVYEILIKFFF